MEPCKKKREETIITKLFKVSLPPMESCVLFQLLSLDLNNLTTEFQVLILLGLTPTRILRNQKGIGHTPQARHLEVEAKNLFESCNGKLSREVNYK